MWFPPLSILGGLAAQIPFRTPTAVPSAMSPVREFKLKAGADTFTPKHLAELARPGAGVANLAGDFALVPVSKYSFEEKKNHKSIYIAPLESPVAPLEIPLTEGGEAFWIGPLTVGHVVANAETKTSSLYAINIRFSTSSLSTPEPPTLIGTFPTATASDFRYAIKTGTLVFSDYVFADGNLTRVKTGDEEWENRGNTALVYDTTYERHWDTWTGPKRPSLFTVKLYQDPDRKWHFGDNFINVLQNTGHEIEPFGGTDDFDISEHNIVYTTKDPELPEAWHTKQNVYVVPFDGTSKPRELTSGKQGATHNPVFNHQGDKVAWLELDEDGYEADRAKIVIYDLTKDVRYTLTQPWDRSPDDLSFSHDSSFLYLTAGDHAVNKVFVLPVPETPPESTTNPALPPYYTTPRALTSSGAATAIQTIQGGRLIFSRSSLQGPNDVFIIRGLKALEAELDASKEVKELKWNSGAAQVTKFTEEALENKGLNPPEHFYFEGAVGKTIHGFAVKPKGWTTNSDKKWPVVLFIHGGPQGAWDDRWSTRWNPNVFAQQGYFVLAFNPTGSTTFGQDLTDAIAKDWGGKPFVDMQKGWKFALEKYPEIDADRAVAAGASWGGYAINWIQGHPEYNFGFKAMVCHDGVFDATYNGFSTDELFFFNHEWGGRPWDPEPRKLLEKFNPRNFVDKWSTPMLVIHGSKDYRLPETDGIAAFHALKEQGIPTRLLIFPDENHWVLNHGNSLKWHYEVFRWFDLYVGEKNGSKAEVVAL